MILLWGIASDEPLRAVRQALRRLGADAVLLDQRDVLETEIEIDFDATVSGVVKTPRRTIDLARVTAVYYRAYDTRCLPRVAAAGEGSEALSHALATDGVLTSWIEVGPGLVINRPSPMASNGSKPYQASLIQAHGFAVPATLVTTEPAAVRAFWERHGEIVYKSISSVRSIVSRLGAAHLDRLGDVVYCPTQFQEYIPGTDYRVHVVGDDVFPAEVVSDADDYRYASRQGCSVELRACDLPEDVADRARSLARSLGLPVAGVDLRRSPDGRWYCFEVNPSPGFTFYESRTEQPIADAIAGLLVQGNAGDVARRPCSIKLRAVGLGTEPLGSGAVWSGIRAASADDAGAVVVAARLEGGDAEEAVLLVQDRVPQILARAGDAAPGGGRFCHFGELDIALGGGGRGALIQAEIEGDRPGQGVFLVTRDGIECLARTGGRSPSGRVYESFGQVSIEGTQRPDARIAFVSINTDGSKSGIIQSVGGAPTEVLTTGRAFRETGEVLDDLRISRLATSLAVVAEVHRPGRIASYRKVIIAGEGLVIRSDALQEGERFPVLGELLEIVTPPAISLQLAFASVRFAGGGALATKDVMGGSEIFARAGDAVPGRADVTVQRFGPPVTNASPLRSGTAPRALIASSVELSDGTRALWLGIMRSAVPVHVETITVIRNVEVGMPSNSSFRGPIHLVKLTNEGTLLFFGPGPDGRRELRTLEGLFDAWKSVEKRSP